ncbi:MAG: hypothetical protein P8Y72_16295 [Anaerolineales bacterium]
MTAKQAHSRSRWNYGKFSRRFLQYFILSIVVVLVFIPIVILAFGALKTRENPPILSGPCCATVCL